MCFFIFRSISSNKMNERSLDDLHRVFFHPTPTSVQMQKGVSYLLNRCIDLKQLSPVGLSTAIQLQKKRKSRQNILRSTVSFIRYVNITSVVQHIVLSQISHE